MAFKLQRPILVSGLSLTCSLWLLESLHPVSLNLGGTVIWGAIALGSSVWWFKQQSSKDLELQLSVVPPDRTLVQKTLTEIETLISQLAAEVEPASHAAGSSVSKLQQKLAQLNLDLDRKQVRLATLGGKSVGKTALTQLLVSHLTQSSPQLPSVDSPSGLKVDFECAKRTQNQPSAGLKPDASEEIAQSDGSLADLVLFVTTGDLTDSEFQRVQQLLTQNQRVMLVFNKQDQYLPTEQVMVLQHLQQRMKDKLAAEDIVAIATAPVAVKVRQYQPDGSVHERLEQPGPNIAPLMERLNQILTQEGQQLILSTVMRRSLNLRSEVLMTLNQVRRDRALPLIEQSQWIAATAAFANPVPSLDLLATAAINTQLVVDLGAIYQQPFSLQQAKTAAGALAEQMIKLGLVEMASQAIAPLLKSNALTYVAGGSLQGVSAAYLTRLAGLSLVEYFEEQSQRLSSNPEAVFQSDRLIQKLKAVFQANQRTAFLQNLVKQGVERLTPASPALSSQP